MADYINVLYLGTMVAQLETKQTNYNDVVGYITGIKSDTVRWRSSRRRQSHDHGPGQVDQPVGEHRGRDGGRREAAASPPHTIATGHEGSVRDQIDYYIQRVRGGEMGMLPALGGLVVLGLLFWAATPFFFTKTNIANLLTQTAALMMLAMALTFVIILAEIDLSAGVTGGLGMAIFILLTNLGGWNWIAGAAGLLRSSARRSAPSSASSSRE